MHIHVLGICGTFMGSLAVLAKELGHRVTGSDANVYPPMSTQLEAQGIELLRVDPTGARRTRFVTAHGVVENVVLFSPTFWAGLMLILIFGKTGLDLLPVLGLHDKDADSLSGAAYAWDVVKHAVLPILTLTYGSLAYLSRQMRAGMLEVIRQDYIRTAKAKGLSEKVVVFKHGLRNALIPVTTIVALDFGFLFSGALITETIFGTQLICIWKELIEYIHLIIHTRLG